MRTIKSALPSAQGVFVENYQKKNEKKAEILKNRQPKAISRELSQKNDDGNILVDFMIPFSILSI